MKKEFNYFRQFQTNDGISFLLRPAKLIDTETIEKNIKSVCAEKFYLYTDTFVLIHEWQKVLSNSVDEKCGDLLIVSQIEQEVVGHLRLFSEWYGQRGRHIGIIGLSLIRKCREKGIGSALLSYAIDWASYVQFEKLTAAIIATNIRALNLFKKFEFQEEAKRKKQLKINGIYYDELLLARFLDN